MTTTIIIICWLAAAFASYGLGLAFFQREYIYIAKSEHHQDVAFCAIMSLVCPLSLFLFFLIIGYNYRHGFKLW